MEWICWLFPACVAMSIMYKRNKETEKKFHVIKELCDYGCWVIGINIITLIVIHCLGVRNVLVEAFSSLSFALKYLVIATVIAGIVPYIKELMSNITIKIEPIDR